MENEIFFSPAAQQDMIIHDSILQLHSRVMACHCECLGMNAENMSAACQDSIPPYTDTHYFQVMQRWGLVDDKFNPII